MNKSSKNINSLCLAIFIVFASTSAHAELSVVTNFWNAIVDFLRGIYPALVGIMVVVAAWQVFSNPDHGKRNAVGTIIGIVILGIAIFDNAEIASLFENS